ncbi:[LysW]-aminoadipate kinase [Candidatus Bipolaricaulota bacterium]|nr:[LysW]-aminoadipate kinase [Candidatus Bipolaricaulota bacterium]
MLVVKIGGSDAIDYKAFLEDLSSHEDWILLHGGSHELDRISEELGHPPRFVESVSGYTSRYTDEETVELINMVYPGKMNKFIVEELQKLGVNAFGFSGMDGRVLECKRKSSLKIRKNGKKLVLRGEHSGIIKKVNTEPVELLLGAGYCPVLTIPAVTFNGTAVNVDGDRAAAEIASAFSAMRLLLLSDVPGLLKDVDSEESLIEEIDRGDIESYTDEYAEGRMKKKLMGAGEAIDAGVSSVILGDGSQEKPVSRALSGEGTLIS